MPSAPARGLAAAGLGAALWAPVVWVACRGSWVVHSCGKLRAAARAHDRHTASETTARLPQQGATEISTVKRTLPWLLSLAIVGYLFWSVDREAFADAMLASDIGTMLSLIAIFSVIVFLADSASLWLLFKRLLTDLPFKDVMAVKGVSYFLNAITYTAAAGGIAYFVHNKRDVTFTHSLSALVWVNFVDIIALVIMLSLGTVFGSHLLPPEVASKLPALCGFFWLIIVGALIYWHLGFDWFVLGRLRSWRIWQCFAEAKGADYVVMIAARMGFLCIYILLGYLLPPTFDIQLGWMELLVYMPLITFVQIVPASISGLGAIQGVIVLLYVPHVAAHIVDPTAQVLAFSTVIGPATTLSRLFIGYAFMSNVARDLVPSEAELEAARQEDDGQ